MAWVAVENFDSYSDGDLHGENGGSGWASAWSGSVEFDVQGSEVFKGTKAIVCNVNSNVEISRNLSSTSETGIVYCAMRKASTDTGSLQINFKGISGTRFRVVLWPNGTLVLNGNTTQVLLNPFVANTWYLVRVTYDTNANSCTASYYTGSAWASDTSAVTMTGTSQQELNGVRLSDSETGATANYWDEITGEDPNIIHVTVTPDTLTATATIPAATITTIRNVTVSPDALSITATIPTATVVIDVFLAPDPLSLTASLPDVLISIGYWINRTKPTTTYSNRIKP